MDYDSEHFHVHMDNESRDSDGGHGSSELIRPDDFHKPFASGYAFKNYMIGSIVKYWEIGGTLTVENEDTMIWHARTDEGYEKTYLRFCSDDDCVPDSTVYDQFAEMSGY